MRWLLKRTNTSPGALRTARRSSRRRSRAGCPPHCMWGRYMHIHGAIHSLNHQLQSGCTQHTKETSMRSGRSTPAIVVLIVSHIAGPVCAVRTCRFIPVRSCDGAAYTPHYTVQYYVYVTTQSGLSHYLHIRCRRENININLADVAMAYAS